MKRSRFSEEQIIGMLKGHQAGMAAAELCRKHRISDATLYTRRKHYGGMGTDQFKELKKLQKENEQL